MIELTPQHHRILDVAESLFSQFGYSHVTTAEIAQSAGVSKKTLYVLFAAKQDIIRHLCFRTARRIHALYGSIAFTDPATFRSDLTAVAMATTTAVAKLSSRLLDDLRTHEPQLLRRIETWQHTYVPSMLATMFRAGQSLGVLRPNINPTIAAAALSRVLLDTVHPEQRRTARYVPRVETVLHILLDGVIKP